jgi:hypothetical protein
MCLFLEETCCCWCGVSWWYLYSWSGAGICGIRWYCRGGDGREGLAEVLARVFLVIGPGLQGGWWVDVKPPSPRILQLRYRGPLHASRPLH